MRSPTRQFATEVVRNLREAGYEAYWAGGCVRDLLRGRAPKDYDVATSARPEEVRALFGKRQTHAVGASFGVILVEAPRGALPVEVATFRTESSYADGRHPDSVEFATAEEDARRRDFTINGMFFDPLEEVVHDYVGGREDLDNEIVRAIGDPHERMREDKLRMLRAVRFAATMDFALDEETAEAVAAMAPEIHIVSAERIAEELRKMLVDPHRRRAVELARRVNLLHEIVPEVTDSVSDAHDWNHLLSTLEALEDPTFELAFAVLLRRHAASYDETEAPEAIRAICRRLRLSNAEADRAVWLIGHFEAIQEAPELPLHELKPLLAHRDADQLLLFADAFAHAEGHESSAADFCRTYLAHTPDEVLDPPPLISGDDLHGLGIEPGPQFKELLTAVRVAQLDETIDTREEALELVARLRRCAGGDKKG